jgi:hypothetical protein
MVTTVRGRNLADVPETRAHAGDQERGATRLIEGRADPARCEQAIGRLEHVPFVWIQHKRTRRRIHMRP